MTLCTGVSSFMKTIAAFLIAFASLHAQGGNSVYQRVFNGTVSYGPSAPVRNIGQQYSLLAVQAIEIGSGTRCATFGWSGAIQLEASYDNVTYFVIGTPITNISNNTYITTSAPGAFAYVRVDYLNGTNTNCKLIAYYSGTITGTPIGSAPYSTFSEQFVSQPFGSAITSPTIIASCTVGRMVVYSLILSNQVSTANTATLAIHDITAPGGTTFTTDIYLPAGAPAFILPQGPRPYLRDAGATAMSFPGDQETLTVALSATTLVEGVVGYRCE